MRKGAFSLPNSEGKISFLLLGFLFIGYILKCEKTFGKKRLKQKKKGNMRKGGQSD